MFEVKTWSGLAVMIAALLVGLGLGYLSLHWL